MKATGQIERLGDSLNPIVVKELRQAVQSRFVVAVLLLFLLAQVLYIGAYVMFESLNGNFDTSDFQGGRGVFSMLEAILLITAMLFVPAYTGFRLAAERSDTHVDLYFIAALRPRAIVTGKFAAALVLALLIFSACAPFMTFTYFLRGIDLSTIFSVISIDFVLVAIAVMLAIFLAVVPANRVVKVLLGLVGILSGFLVIVNMLSITYLVLHQGIPFLGGSDVEVIWSTVIIASAGVIGFLGACAVGLLSPHSANRTLPLRLAVTLFGVGGGLLLTGVSLWSEETGPMSLWMFQTGMLLFVGVLVAVNEREQWAPRLARTIPRRAWLRPLAFLFYSGAAGGLLWTCALGLACWLVFQLWVSVNAAPNVAGDLARSFRDLALLFAYLICYGLTAIFLRNTVLRISPLYTWVIVLMLMAAGSILPYLITFLIHRGSWSFATHYYWLVTNPGAGIALLGEAGQEYGLMFLAAWATLGVLLNARWFWRQIAAFRPYRRSFQPGETVPAILSATPIEPSRP